MNCKPGDMAVIVRSEAENAGKLVHVVRKATAREVSGWRHASEGLHWWVEAIGSPIVSTLGVPRMETALPDARLRPIRDQPGADETLSWAALPRPVRVVQAA